MRLLLGESEFSVASDLQQILFGDWNRNEPYAAGSGKYDPSDVVTNETNAHLKDYQSYSHPDVTDYHAVSAPPRATAKAAEAKQGKATTPIWKHKTGSNTRQSTEEKAYSAGWIKIQAEEKANSTST